MSRCTRCFGDLDDLTVFCPHCAQIHEPDFDHLINQQLHLQDRGYRIDRRLGQGGLSTVFAATDLCSGRAAVIKVSDPAQLARRDLSYNIDAQEARSYWTEMVDRMRREAEVLVNIEHPNIVRFYGTGMINQDLRYVVMEFLRGRTLRDEIAGRSRIEIAEALRMAQEIVSGLQEVHSRGIVHRDINPSNIFIESLGQTPQIKLIDFGIAKFPQPPGAPPFTRYSVMSGTVAYASPEQCQNHPLDYRTDIYSLGVVLYEMLTGQRPFSGRTPTEVALHQIQAQPASPRALNPALPAGVERAILRALAKNPGDRQQSVGELARELRAGASNQIIIPLRSETIIHKLPEAANVEKAHAESSSPSRRRRASVVTASLILLLAVGVMLGRHLIMHEQTAVTMKGSSPGTAATPSALENQSDQASDADAMETAARLLQEGIKEMTSLANPTPQPAASPAPGIEHGSSETGSQPEPLSSPPAPPKAQPQTPPLTIPPVIASHLLKPESEPDASQAPKIDIENSDRSDGGIEDRYQGSPSGDHRRQQLQTEDGAPYDDEDTQRAGPRLIQWNGEVARERVITIEMPGVPGTIEIPRAYRDRVGIIESPSHNNKWRYAVLRVFGQGPVTVLVRWWPMASKMANFSER